MSLSLQQLLDVAIEQAMRGMEVSPSVDVGMIAESLAPNIFQDVAEAAARDPRKRSLLYRTHAVAFTNGVGTLPDEVLTSCKDGMSVLDPADQTVGPLMSLVPNFNDFISPLDNRLGYYCIKQDNTIHWINPNEDYDPSSGITKNIQVTIATVPAIPTLATDDIDCPDEIASDLIAALAEALKGAIGKVAAQAT